jgi:hypothetical protein
MSLATWYTDLDWLAAARDAAVAALKASAAFKRALGSDTIRTYDDPLIARDLVEPVDCPFCAVGIESADLGRINNGRPDDEKASLFIVLATADNSLAAQARLMLAARQALVDGWAEHFAPARDGSLCNITFKSAPFIRVPSKEDARPIWVSELSLLLWFEAPTV